jgi:hypothetical protein
VLVTVPWNLHFAARAAVADLADDIARAPQVLTADLARVQEAQDADRSSARTRAGLRALVRMIKPDAATS